MKERKKEWIQKCVGEVCGKWVADVERPRLGKEGNETASGPLN
jgi:hypothetical protein